MTDYIGRVKTETEILAIEDENEKKAAILALAKATIDKWDRDNGGEFQITYEEVEAVLESDEQEYWKLVGLMLLQCVKARD